VRRRARRGLRAPGGGGGDRDALRAPRGDRRNRVRGRERTRQARPLVADEAADGDVRAERRGRRDPLGRRDERRGRAQLRAGRRAAGGAGRTLVLLRHAWAGHRKDWDGDDVQRPLDERGWQQAKELRKELRRRGVTRAVSSPYVRCTQTLEPLGLAIEV